jgi:hypothetical protein
VRRVQESSRLANSSYTNANHSIYAAYSLRH